MKNAIFILIVFTSIILIIAPAKSQTYPIIKADTVFKGYSKGQTSSIRIVNHGTRIVYNYNGKLYEMNALTYKPIRDIALDDLDAVSSFSMDENCKYIIYRTKQEDPTFIADYNTGKTIKTLNGAYILSKDFLFLRYGDSSNSYTERFFKFSRLRINDLSPLDSLTYVHKQSFNYPGTIESIRTIYPENRLLFELVTTPSLQYDGDLSWASWLEFDFKTKKINSLGLKSDGTSYYLLSTSGKSSVFISSSYNQISSNPKYYEVVDTYFSINSPNGSFSFSHNEFKKKFNDGNLNIRYDFVFVADKFLCFSVDYKENNKQVTRVFVYNLQSKSLTKMIDFASSVSACYNNKIIFSNYYGCFATITLDQLSAP